MTVTASALVAAESAPTAPDDVWEPVAFFQPNWATGVRITTRFATSVFRGSNGAETRTGLAAKPTREITFVASGFGQGPSLLSNIMLQRLAQAYSLQPLWPDLALLTSATGIGTTIAIPTADRRFFVGGRVLLFARQEGNTPVETFHLATITAVNANDIEIDTPTTSDFAAGSVCVPLIEAQIAFEGSQRFLTGTISQVPLEAKEPGGVSTLDAVATLGSWPAGTQTHDGVAIFDFLHNQGGTVDYELSVPGEIKALGRGVVVSREDAGLPLLSASLEIGFAGRDEYWPFLEFFEAARGRLASFWFLGNTQEYEILGFGASSVTVTAVGPEQQWDYVPHLGIRAKDGTIQIREVQSVIRSSGQDILTLDSGFSGLSVSDVRSASHARRARFGTDALEELWDSTSHVRVRVTVEELVEEKTVSIGSFQDLADGSPAGAAANPRGLVTDCFGDVAFDYLWEINANKDGRDGGEISSVPTFGSRGGVDLTALHADTARQAQILQSGGGISGHGYYLFDKANHTDYAATIDDGDWPSEDICVAMVMVPKSASGPIHLQSVTSNSYPTHNWQNTRHSIAARSRPALTVSKGDGSTNWQVSISAGNIADHPTVAVFQYDAASAELTGAFAQVVHAPTVVSLTPVPVTSTAQPDPTYLVTDLTFGVWTNDSLSNVGANREIYSYGVLSRSDYNQTQLRSIVFALGAQFGLDFEL